MRTSAPPLLAIFRSQLQGDLLARVMLGSQEQTLSDLARTLGAPLATVAREVSRLEQAGLLTTRRVGRARLVATDDTNPATGPLRQLVTVAFGPQQVVAEEFAAIGGIVQVIIFGSWAARASGELGPVPGDVDVLIVGQPDRDEVFDAAERAQQRLGRPVNTTTVSEQRWQSHDEPFLAGVHDRPRITVLEPPVMA
jgi:DNA-binding transcriptional ArsR family regulator